MIVAGQRLPILITAKPVDFRCGHQALALMVQTELKLDPHSGGERAARRHEQAVVAEKEAFITELKALIERLEGHVQDYRRTKFGPKSEKPDPSQLELASRVWKRPLPRHRRRSPLSRTGSRTMSLTQRRESPARLARRGPSFHPRSSLGSLRLQQS